MNRAIMFFAIVICLTFVNQSFSQIVTQPHPALDIKLTPVELTATATWPIADLDGDPLMAGSLALLTAREDLAEQIAALPMRFPFPQYLIFGFTEKSKIWDDGLDAFAEIKATVYVLKLF